MTKKMETVMRMKELAQEIYDTLDEMEDLLRENAPSALERAKGYWMAHVDGALFNRKGWLGGSFISLSDTIEEIVENEEVCPHCESENWGEVFLTGEIECLECEARWET